jgi:phage shock protein E
MKSLLHSGALLLLLLGHAAHAEEPLWVDVRSPEEFAGGHLPGAHNISYLEVAVAVPKLAADKDTEIRVYCAAGVRAEIAKLQLQAAGYRNVVNEGGYTDIVQRSTSRGARPCRQSSDQKNPEEEAC